MTLPWVIPGGAPRSANRSASMRVSASCSPTTRWTFTNAGSSFGTPPGSSTRVSGAGTSRAWRRSSARRRSGGSSTAACRSWAASASPTTRSSRGYGAKFARSASMMAPLKCTAGRSPSACFDRPALIRHCPRADGSADADGRRAAGRNRRQDRSARRCPLARRRRGTEFLEQRVADGVKVEAVRGDQGARLDNDVVDIAHQLQPFVEVFTIEAETFAENFHEVHDLEAATVADIAELAVTGVIDRCERRHPGIGHGCELARDQLALELRQDREAVCLRPDPGHVDLDELDARDDRQELAHRLLYGGQYRPFVQGHPLLDPLFHHPGEGLGMPGEEDKERVQIEWAAAEPRLVARQAHLAELDLAARAPGEHGRGPGRREAVDRRVRDARGIVEIALAELINAAALSGTAHDLVIDPEQIEDIEA